MQKIKVGIVGTGYAATKRAEAIGADDRAELVAIAGSSATRAKEFAAKFKVSALDSWEKLVDLAELDLIFICTVNSLHGAIATAALKADKHIVVEYPLALDPHQAAEIVTLAEKKNKLLHVEHIELLGGLHQAIKQNLAKIGDVFYARYATVSPRRDVGKSWKYDYTAFGFPLAAALSRIHRLTDLFGTVKSVSSYCRYWNTDTDYFTACLCNARLEFAEPLIAEITYGKGNVFWQAHRTFEIHGDRGTLIFEGERGTLIRDRDRETIPVTSRRGLFARDTALVLDVLLNDTASLYVRPQASLYALQVANAASLSSETRQIVTL